MFACTPTRRARGTASAALVLLLVSCVDKGAGETGRHTGQDSPPVGDADSPVETGHSAETGHSGETGETGHSGETGETGESGDPLPVEPDLVMASDSARGVYLYLRPDDGTVVRSVDLAELNPGRCGGELCVSYGGGPDLSRADGRDAAILVFTPTDDEAEGASVIQKVRLSATGAVTDWTLDSLDFFTNFSAYPDLCAQEAPCTVPDEDLPGLRRGCRLQGTHEVQVVEDSADSVLMWIADTTAPSRLLKVRLDKATTCGVVEDVLSAETVDPFPTVPIFNDVDVVDLGDGVESLLASSLNSGDLEGRSTITLWRKVDGAWTEGWRYPPEGSDSYLSAVHNPDLVEDVDGQRYIVYANGNGLGEHHDPNEYTGTGDHLGSVGVARLGTSGPEYLFDAVVPDGFGFLRDVNRLDDGTWLVTDSGCMSVHFEDCDKTGKLWHVSLPDLSTVAASGLGGSFSPDHSDMSVIEATPLLDRFTPPLECGLVTPYSAHLIPWSALGGALTADLDRAEECPVE